MVFCANCGADIEEFNKFCSKCGNRVEKPDMSTARQVKKANVDNDSEPSQLSKKGVLDRLDIEREEIDQVTEKAKKSLSRLGVVARRGLKRGVDFASEGIEAAKETIDERRGISDNQDNNTMQESGIKFCQNCGKALEITGIFCNHCGEKLV